MSTATNQYLQQSRRPLASLAFLTPLLMIYEGGILALGSDAVRNGADVWLRQILEHLHFGQYFLLPVLTVAALLAWHHTTREPWRISGGVLYYMFLECALLALVLFVIAQAQHWAMEQIGPSLSALEVVAAIRRDTVGLFVGYLGAGIYEEVMFRLLLIPLVAMAIGVVGGSPKIKTVGAVLITSLLFSAAHYLGPEPFEWYSFLFRFIAGVFFAVLLLYRGFGIAAGTHAGFDLFAGLLFRA